MKSDERAETTANQFEERVNGFKLNRSEERKYATNLDTKSIRTLALMHDYYAATCEALNIQTGKAIKPTDATTKVIRTLFGLDEHTGMGKMAVVRFQFSNGNGDADDECKEFQRRMLELQRRGRDGDLKFAVLRATQGDNFCAQLETDGQMTFLDRMRKWRSDDDFIPESFMDLADMPCLLILVGRGKMGDTFPNNLAAWDLRARYDGGVCKSTFLQDVGRTFGWRSITPGETPTIELPDLLLGMEAREAFVTGDYSKWDLHLKKNRNGARSAAPSPNPNPVPRRSELPPPPANNQRSSSRARSVSVDHIKDTLDGFTEIYERAYSKACKQEKPSEVLNAILGTRPTVKPTVKPTPSACKDYFQERDRHTPVMAAFIEFRKSSDRIQDEDFDPVIFTVSNCTVRGILECVREELRRDNRRSQELTELSDHLVAKVKKYFADFAFGFDDSEGEDQQQFRDVCIESNTIISRVEEQDEMVDMEPGVVRRVVGARFRARPTCLIAHEGANHFYTEKTILFTAMPQLGKTGSFIQLIRRMEEHYTRLVEGDGQRLAVRLRWDGPADIEQAHSEFNFRLSQDGDDLARLKRRVRDILNGPQTHSLELHCLKFDAPLNIQMIQFFSQSGLVAEISATFMRDEIAEPPLFITLNEQWNLEHSKETARRLSGSDGLSAWEEYHIHYRDCRTR